MALKQTKILIVKIGAIGDAVMVLPLLRHIRKTQPYAHITWIGGKIIKELMLSWGLIDEYVTVDEKALFDKNPLIQTKTIFAVWKKLFFKRFSRLLILHNDWRYTLLTLTTLSKTKKRTSHVKDHKQYIPHEDLYLSCYSKEKTQYFPGYPKIASEKSFHRTIVMLPGGAKNSLREQSLKRWPIYHYQTLAKQLLKRGFSIIMIGGPDDQWVVPHFEKLGVMNTIGQTSLYELCDLIQKASLFITHDSGPLHLAKLTSTPTIALFGPTSPLHFAARASNIHVMTAEQKLPCQPCYDGIHFADCQKNLCLDLITPEMVLQKIEIILNPSPLNALPLNRSQEK
jgi:heptosyltransferase II